MSSPLSHLEPPTGTAKPWWGGAGDLVLIVNFAWKLVYLVANKL